MHTEDQKPDHDEKPKDKEKEIIHDPTLPKGFKQFKDLKQGKHFGKIFYFGV